MKLEILSVMIILIFSGGMITYFYAIFEIGKTPTLFYTRLSVCGALLAMIATFAAIIAGKLGLLR